MNEIVTMFSAAAAALAAIGYFGLR